MAAKHKQRRKTDANKRVFVRPEDEKMEEGEEEEEAAYGRERNTAKKDDEEELSLDEVLRLGGTKVSSVEVQREIVLGGTDQCVCLCLG